MSFLLMELSTDTVPEAFAYCLYTCHSCTEPALAKASSIRQATEPITGVLTDDGCTLSSMITWHDAHVNPKYLHRN